jgi:molecular chaperone Hsp33
MMRSEKEPTRRRLAGDDMVLPFQIVSSGVMGRIVRLGAVADTILTRHDYPEPVSHALGEGLALTAMLGTTIKLDGKLILQTKTDGPLDLLVVDYQAPGHVRGYASFNREHPQLDKAAGRGDQGALLGSGHVALTIDASGDMDRYQGIVAVAGDSLVDAAHTYFRQSEQLPTFIRLAVARHYGPTPGGGERSWRWRAGGLMIQHLARVGGRGLPAGADAEELDARLKGEDEENWTRARHLAATVEDHELLDPTLAPERLLYRLFHEEGVKVTRPRALAAHCRCSRERILRFLKRFGADELQDMRERDGGITVTCEFCSTKYRFEWSEVD